jgi:hypothetical protein
MEITNSADQLGENNVQLARSICESHQPIAFRS